MNYRGEATAPTNCRQRYNLYNGDQSPLQMAEISTFGLEIYRQRSITDITGDHRSAAKKANKRNSLSWSKLTKPRASNTGSIRLYASNLAISRIQAPCHTLTGQRCPTNVRY